MMKQPTNSPAEEPHQTDLIKDVRGTSTLTLEQTNQLHCLINSFSSILQDKRSYLTMTRLLPSTGSPTAPPFIGSSRSNRSSRHSWTKASSDTPPHHGPAQSWLCPRKLEMSGSVSTSEQRSHNTRYPLPRIDDLLATVSAANYLTTLDLTKGYHKIQLTPQTIPKTAFTAHCGKFEYVRLPFGLCNAPAHFQRCMDLTFSDIPTQGYIDDRVIATESWQDHLTILQLRCKQKNITLKLKKCCFAAALLDCLGHTIGSGTILPQDIKVEAIIIMKFPIPSTRKQVKSFLGTIGNTSLVLLT